MAHHFTKNTVAATFWCTVCHAATEHHVLGGRRAGCKVCEARQVAEKAERERVAAERKAEPVQQSLF
jgi:cob(I)alamin adenosyltransferase